MGVVTVATRHDPRPASDASRIAGPRSTTTTQPSETTTSLASSTSTSTTLPAVAQATTTTARRNAAAPTTTPRVPASAGCSVFPADNPWNTDISNLPIHPNSANFVSAIGVDGHLHPDFGTFYDGGPIGIPFTTVGAGQPKVPVSFDYADESDPGPYPIPPDAPIEGGPQSDGDRHVLVVDTSACRLYELYDAHQQGNGWHAGSGAVFDLRSNALRPDYWTSADAAGLPIYAGLVRYAEVQAGAINHALRFTVSRTQRGFIHPATHYASSATDPNLPPMGLRLRMKASYSCAALSREAQVVCAALKRFGMIVADNGSNWFISGEHNPAWNDDALGDIKRIPGSAFDVVNTGAVIH
jgi:hypothetical protein